MAQEFVIKSKDIEDKINQLLPSQGGAQPGVDFSASTMVIPVVDLTETAEGSNLRQDLQTAFSLTTASVFDISGSALTIINTTGYYRIFGNSVLVGGNASTDNNGIRITDGTTNKKIFVHQIPATTVNPGSTVHFDFVVKVEAGNEVKAFSTGASTLAQLQGTTRQIADINGNLINP